jgi:hypothetical protein
MRAWPCDASHARRPIVGMTQRLCNWVFINGYTVGSQRKRAGSMARRLHPKWRFLCYWIKVNVPLTPPLNPTFSFSHSFSIEAIFVGRYMPNAV